MNTRRIYSERTNLILKDIADQVADEYVAVFEGAGDKGAVTFAKFTAVNGIIILFASPTALAEKEGKIVASFPVESQWAIVRRERFIEMNGEQWEAHKVVDAACKKAQLEKYYGADKLMTMVVSPNGDQVVLPPTEQEVAKFKAASGASVPAASKPYDDSALYR